MAQEAMVLAGDFPAPTQEQWQREVLKALNRKRPPGAELTIEQAMKRLTTRTVDGLSIDPLYLAPADQRIGYPGQSPFTRGAKTATGWVVAQLHEDPDIARTVAAIDADLNAGASGVWLRVDPDAIAPGDVATVLAGVDPTAARIAVSSTDVQDQAAQALIDFWAGFDPTAVSGNLGIDPLARAAVTGQPGDLSQLSAWVDKVRPLPEVRALVVDATPYDNAGASDVDQLGFAIASGIEYLRALDDQGVAPPVGLPQILFRVSASADQFVTIARLRALRRLWARVGQVVGVPEAERGARQHVVTSWRMLSRDDPWVNLLRNTVATFSAAIGDAEVVTVLPHDTAYGLPTEFSRRIARNIQLVAGEEAHLGAVKDPAGGAWVYESLTDQVAQQAWARVQAIEAAGGMSAALAQGLVGQWIDQTSTERAKRLATRRQPLTGVSMFPLADEQPLTGWLGRPARPSYAGLAPYRDAEVFERLRQRSRAHQQATGRVPTVILACLGTRRDFGAREQFTTNLLLVAGLGFVELEGATGDQIVAAARDHQTDLVILASSGKVYAAQGLAAAQASQAAGLTTWIAGRVTEIADPGAADLIDGEIFDGMNVVTFLTSTLDHLEVAS
jgi:methylmalonyl-CoA mutase